MKRLLQDSLKYFHSVPPSDLQYQPNQPGVVRFPLKGTYLGENAKGDQVFVMQSDNMPCLVPGKSFYLNMPVAAFEPGNKVR